MHVQYRSQIESRKLSSSLIRSFLTELTVLNKMSVFSKNWTHDWKSSEQTENFQRIMVIIFVILQCFNTDPTNKK